MEDIDCQSEQLIAPNKLQMFCMHSCSIYLCMCINFKKKAVKSVSVLALSLQSFICLQAVRCRFCIFSFSFFLYFPFPPTQQRAWKQPAAQVLLSAFADRYVFFFFVSCSFEAYLHHCWKSSALTCNAHEAEHGQKWAKMADGSLRWFLISLWKSQKQKHKLPVRTYQHAAPPHLRRWWCAQVGHRFRPLPQSPGR